MNRPMVTPLLCFAALSTAAMADETVSVSIISEGGMRDEKKNFRTR